MVMEEEVKRWTAMGASFAMAAQRRQLSWQMPNNESIRFQAQTRTQSEKQYPRDFGSHICLLSQVG